MAEVERHIAKAIVDSVQLLSSEELLDVVLHDGDLCVGSVHCPCGLSADAVSKGENVGESFVLKSVAVHVNHAVATGDARVEELLVSDTSWVDIRMVEWVLEDFSAINVLESGNLLTDFTIVDFLKLPSEHNFDSSLVAFVKSDFVSITEFINFFVWSPVLNF